MPHCTRPTLSVLLPPLLLALLLALTACAPSGPARDRFDATLGKGEEHGIRDVTILATTSTLLIAGREAFDAGHYAVAATRFEAVLKKDPDNALGTAYLGLCHWFQGRPKATNRLWASFTAKSKPPFAPVLRENGSSLTLLAHRLRARGIAEDARHGFAQPLARELAVVAVPRQASDNSLLALPSVGRALHLLLLDALAAYDTPRTLERGLLTALCAETGLPGTSAEDALLLAQMVGAEYAVSTTLEPAPHNPGLVRTRVTVTPAEAQPLRHERLGKTAQQAALAATEAQQALGALDQDLTLTAFGLKYFEAGDQLNALLAERTVLENRILGLNRAGSLTAAAVTVAQLRELETDIATAQRELRKLERAAVGLASHIFAYNAAALTTRDLELRAARVELAARVTELAQKADVAFAVAARQWPAGGISTTFDLAPEDLPRWPALAADALASILHGRPMPDTLPQAFAPGATAAHLATLDRALAAWDNGEYARAMALYAEAAPLAPAPPSAPDPAFDPLRQVAMRPEQIAALYADRLVAAHDAADRAQRREALPTRPWE